MRWLAERLQRVRWLAVPLAAYVAITLVLPAANGAATRPEFAGHALWVLAGCACAIAVAVIGGELWSWIARITRVTRLARRPANHPHPRTGGRPCES